MGVVPEVDSTEEGTLFANGRKFELFGGAGEEDGSVVAEDAGEDLIGTFSLCVRRATDWRERRTMTIVIGNRIQ